LKLTGIVSVVGNLVIVGLSIFLAGLIFNYYGNEATFGEKLAYSVIFAAAIFTLIYTFKFTVIWFIKALKK
jgi:hypothetical protein